MSVIETGSGTPGIADVDGNHCLLITTARTNASGVSVAGGSENAPAFVVFSENDDGISSGARFVRSMEVDDDFRLRVAQEHILDRETFNYTSQNTAKHSYANTTLAFAWSGAGMQSNSGGITTVSTGARVRTWREFPLASNSHLYCEFQASIDALTPANTTLDLGLFRDGGATPYAPTDGAYFRFSAAGVVGVVNYNGTETSTAVFSLVPSLNRRYKFTISITERVVRFWIDDSLYASIPTPVGQGQPFQSTTLPFAVRHGIAGGAAGAVMRATVSDYAVTYGGHLYQAAMDHVGNRSLGAYQGFSGGTLGQLATWANAALPTTATPTNTTATTTGLGGIVAFNAPVAGASDLNLCSYQIPAGSASVQGRACVIRGIRLDFVNTGAAVATTPTLLALALAFGHSAVSLATTDAAAAHAPRRVALGLAGWQVADPIGQPSRHGPIEMRFDAPIYVNPGEFVALVAKPILGTATASQVIYGTWALDYGWE